MEATRSIQPLSFTPLRATDRDNAMRLLGEVVAQLSERVELLEAREHLRRMAFAPPQAGTAEARE